MTGRGVRALGDRGRALLAAGVTLVISGIVLGFVDLVRVGALCVGLVAVVTVLLARYHPRLEVDRRAGNATMTVDQTSRVWLDVRNVGPRRTPPLTAQDEVGRDLGGVPQLSLGACPPAGTAQVGYDVRPRRRGRHRIGPLTVSASDPFGLGTVRRTVAETTEVVVLPRLHDLSGAAATPIGGGGSGESARRGAALGAVDQSIRDYRSGDDLRRIHWPVTAHRGDLMVREDTTPGRRRAVLVVDPPPAATPGSAEQTARLAALDWLVEALASVAVRLGDLEHELHLVTPELALSGRATAPVTADTLVRTLAVLETAGITSPGGGVDRPLVTETRELAGDGGVLVVATTDLDSGAAHDLLAARAPASRGLLLVVDSRSFGSGHRSVPAEDVVRLATTGGWTARAVRAGDTVPEVWDSLMSEVAP